jgi:hypothetical protein
MELAPAGGAHVPAALSRVRLTLVRDAARWRLDVVGRRQDEPWRPTELSLSAETLGELRVHVEDRFGDGTWRALLQAAGSTLEAMAPGIMGAPSVPERVRFD